MPRSWRPASAINDSGPWVEISVTTRPMKSGMVVSRTATRNPATKSAATSQRACRA